MQIKLRTLIFVLVLFALFLFASINWGLFIAPSTLNLLFGTVVAPLGLVMLAIVAGLSVLYLLFLGRVEAGAIVGRHRSAKELEEARKLASSAEESRLRELREELDERLGRIEEKLSDLLRHSDAGSLREPIRPDPAAVPD